MAELSKIEWTDHTFNPWYGCQKVSPGCDNCYAEGWAKRSGLVTWGPGQDRRRSKTWGQPVKWNRKAKEAGQRAKVFCASLADIFDNKVPREWREDLWKLIRETPYIDWQILTKRPENIKKFLPDDWGAGYPNVWLGFTAEDQEHYDRRWPIMRGIPARIRFVSHEPSIGCLWNLHLAAVVSPDWIICGGESGPGARYMDPDWARRTRDACERSAIAFFMKQMTGKKPIPADLLVRQFPESTQ